MASKCVIEWFVVVTDKQCANRKNITMSRAVHFHVQLHQQAGRLWFYGWNYSFEHFRRMLKEILPTTSPADYFFEKSIRVINISIKYSSPIVDDISFFSHLTSSFNYDSNDSNENNNRQQWTTTAMTIDSNEQQQQWQWRQRQQWQQCQRQQQWQWRQRQQWRQCQQQQQWHYWHRATTAINNCISVGTQSSYLTAQMQSNKIQLAENFWTPSWKKTFEHQNYGNLKSISRYYCVKKHVLSYEIISTDLFNFCSFADLLFAGSLFGVLRHIWAPSTCPWLHRTRSFFVLVLGYFEN